MALSQKEVIERLKKANILDKDGKPLPYSKFKNFAAIHRYKGKRGTAKVVFIGQPKVNLISFYYPILNDPDTLVLRVAYKWFLQLANGDLTPLVDEEVKIGTGGIPLTLR